MVESINLFAWMLNSWSELDLLSKAAVVLVVLYPVLNIIVEMTPTQIDNIALKFIVDKVARPMVQSKRTRAALVVDPPVAANVSAGKPRNRERKSKPRRSKADGDGMSSGDV